MEKRLFPTLLFAACATSGSNAAPPLTASELGTQAVRALIDGDYATALDRSNRGLVLRRNDPWLLYNRGAALAGLGRIDQALETLRAAEQQFGNRHARAIMAYRRGLVLELAGRCAEASTELAQYAAAVYDDEPTLAEKALEHLKFCIPPTEEQQTERAETAALRKRASDPRLRLAQALSSASVEALAKGDYSVALAQAEAGLLAMPTDPWLLYNKGTALAGLGRVEEAIATLRVAERLFSPQNKLGRSVATYRRALALEIAGRCDEAGQELLRYAAMMGPSEPDLAMHALEHIEFCEMGREINGL